ncbi:MAG: hypothetical protein HY203_11215 [Nitrospirae bacterium]|nr:hypothetical protein [Nitrospirota bacterium]
MDDQEIRKSIVEVTRAIENLNKAFEKRAADLKQAGDTEGLQQWTKACQAMRDSGNIYITWAQHYARLSDPTAPSEEEDGFLNEGAVWDETPSGP